MNHKVKGEAAIEICADFPENIFPIKPHELSCFNGFIIVFCKLNNKPDVEIIIVRQEGRKADALKIELRAEKTQMTTFQNASL